MNAIELTRDLIRIDTVNPPGNESPCAGFLGRLLEDAGFSVAYDEFAENRSSLIARIGGSDRAAPICLTGHIDTVSIGDAPWRKAPLGGEIDDGKVHGRGASDMKSGVAAMVAAASKLVPMIDGTPGVVLVLTGGEETGCLGSKHLETRPDILGAAGAIVVGEPTANYPVIGHKGSIKFHVHATGVAAHGATPEKGVNAIYKAAKTVLDLQAFDFHSSAHPIMGRPTLNIGTIQGGANVNSVPDSAKIGVDIRTVAGVDQDGLLSDIRRCLDEEARIDIYQNEVAVWTEPDEPWIQDVYDLVQSVRGERPEPRSVSYFTDAGSLRRAFGQPPTVILGPGEPDLAHQTDEYCFLNKIDEAEAMYEEILRRWCDL